MLLETSALISAWKNRWDLSPGSAAVDLHVADTAGYEGKRCSEAQIRMLEVTNLAPKYHMI